MSDIRYNLIEDRFVIIAPERLHRPIFSATLPNKKELIKEHIISCPFCKGNEYMTTPEIYSLRNKQGWKTRVVPNLYKAVSIESNQHSKYDGIFKSYEGFGAHEVLIDTPKHDVKIYQWTIANFIDWITTLQHRINDLKNDSRLNYLSIFKNYGALAGASQSHPHTQLIALPIIPTNIVRQYEQFAIHYKDTGNILIEDIIVQEYNDKERIVFDNKNFVAFCPYASEYPFEVIIASKEGLSRLEDIDENEKEELSIILSKVFRALTQALGDFDFNLIINIPPLQDEVDSFSRLNIRITPRIYQHAGFELATQMMINPIEPKEAAKKLRGV